MNGKRAATMNELKKKIPLTHGFVNMMSDAPSVHLVVRDLRKYLTGRTPHVIGSSRLEVGGMTGKDYE
jgi:hypothetical protein